MTAPTNSESPCLSSFPISHKPAILFESGAHAEWLAKPLVESGWALRRCAMREVPEHLATGRFTVLVLGRFYSLRRTQTEEAAAVNALRTAVADFLARGGGVFFALPIEGGVVDFKPFLDDFDVRILELGVEQDSNRSGCHGPSEENGYAAYTDCVHPGFVQGMNGVWFPCGGSRLSRTSRPVWGDPAVGWFSILTGMADSRTSSGVLMGHGGVSVDPNHPGFDSHVPIIAGRQVGPGRLAVCGISSGYHVCAPHNFPQARRFLADGFDGRPSGLRPLLFNIWKWLDEPAAGRLGGAETEAAALEPQTPRFPDDPPVAWANRDVPRPPKPPIQGLVGARTVFSNGDGTVADYVARARERGLGFLVFLETFSLLRVGGLEALKAECRRHCRDGFLAIPGYTIEDVAGCRFFYYGPDIVVPEDDLLDPAGERLATGKTPNPRNCSMSTVHAILFFGTLAKGCRSGRFHYGDCPVIFEEHRFLDSAGLVTWHDGRVVDDQRERFGLLAAQGLRMNPTVVTLLDRPADVDRALADGWRVGITEPYADMPRDVLRKWMAPELEWWGMIDEARTRKKEFRFANMQYGVPFQWITEGPDIHEWTASVTRRDPSWRAPDVEIPPTADPYRVDVLHFILRIRVSAEAGLDRVALFDGERPIRRWRVGGRATFDIELDMIHDRQMHLWLEVTDAAGRRAISGDYTTLRLDWCEFYCADRNNPLMIGFECGENRHAYGWSGTIYLMYNTGPWGGTSHITAAGRLWWPGDCIRPVPSDPISDERAPCDGGAGNPGSSLHIWPLVPGEESLMVRCFQEMISPDVAMDRIVLDRVFDWDWPWFWGRREAVGCGGQFPSQPTRYFEMSRRARVFRPIPGLLTSLIYDYDVRWKRRPDFTEPIVIGWLDGEAAHGLHRRGGETVRIPGRDKLPFRMPWRPGEYIVSRKVDDSPAIFFNDGCELELYRDTESDPNVGDGCTNPRGERIVLRLLPTAIPTTLRFFAAGVPSGYDGDKAAARYVQAMGLAGTPDWPVDVFQGCLRAQRMMLELDAHDGGVVFRWEGADLPAGLPVAVHGLNPNGSVVLFDRRAETWRPLGQYEGTTYASLDPREKWDLYIGHPFLADAPDLVLNLVQIGGQEWRLEIHNPTDRDIDSRITRSPHFTLLEWAETTHALAAGESVAVSWRNGRAAAGRVRGQ